MNDAIKQFKLSGNAVSCEPYGSGHINHTQLVVTDSGKRYILQQINNTIFKDVDALMENIIAVTGHIAKNDPDPRHVLTLVPTVDGKAYYKDAEGRYFRVPAILGDGGAA